jgi:hypothetical protein
LIASAPTIVIVGGVVSDVGGFTGTELPPPPPQAISTKDRIPMLPNFTSLAKPLNEYINYPKITVIILTIFYYNLTDF